MSGPAAVREASATRNVVLVGPQGAGKTMLVESVLHAAGVTSRLGRVEDGTTVCDDTDAEKRLGHSVGLSVATTDLVNPESGDHVRVTFLDTPGHPDFVGDVRAGLRAADAALFVISSVDGIDPATAMLWRECALEDIPRAVVITHLDAQQGNYAKTLGEARAAFGDGVHPLYLPLGEGSIAVISGTVHDQGASRPATDDEKAAVADARGETVEAVITESEDETMLDRYLGGEEITFDEIIDDLKAAISRASFYPVLGANPTTGMGAAEITELVTRGFPTPAEHHMPAVFATNGGDHAPIMPTADGPLIAEVVKTTADAYVGRISIVRVFSGTLRADTQIHISGHLSQFTGDERDENWHAGHDSDTRAGALSRMLGSKLTPVEIATAGDVVAVAHLDAAETGDTLSSPEDPVVIEPWNFPHPLLPVAVRAAASKDEDKLMRGLARLQAENPSTQVVVDSETGQLVLWTMGEKQYDLLMESLKAREGVEVETEPVKVAVHETVRASAPGIGRHVKQSGGHGQFAIAHVTVEPLGEGGGFEFVDEVVGGVVPRQFIPSVEKGVRAQMEHGVSGYPMVDIRVRLTGGKAHSVDSSDAAFQTAGSMALKEAAAAAGIQMLEPVDEVSITVDDDFVGAVMSDLASRRGRVRGTEPAAAAGRTTVTAEVPAFELLRYPQVLRSLGHGSGEFTRSFAHYAPAPTAVQERLAAAAKRD